MEYCVNNYAICKCCATKIVARQQKALHFQVFIVLKYLLCQWPFKKTVSHSHLTEVDVSFPHRARPSFSQFVTIQCSSYRTGASLPLPSLPRAAHGDARIVTAS